MTNILQKLKILSDYRGQLVALKIDLNIVFDIKSILDETDGRL